ncbi:MAG TPA: hypothetical protein VLB27_04805, partial [candidate division Zixibacteria bacterium]|nr:hypothetical protein [candidate division Zixibacteria bacterium]
MPLRRLTIITICALWCVTWGMVPSVHGQIIHGQRPQLSQGLTYISWKVKGKEEFTLAQLFLPVSAHAPLKDNVEVAVFGGASRSEADWAVQGDDISGLVDSRVQIAASLNNDQILLSAGASLPTGQTRLTPVQQLLMTFMSADFLNFPVKTPGEGFNLFGEVGAAFPLGPWAAGVAGAVFVAGEYKPYETDLTYRPGSRIVLTTGLERVWTGSEH